MGKGSVAVPIIIVICVFVLVWGIIIFGLKASEGVCKEASFIPITKIYELSGESQVHNKKICVKYSYPNL